MNSGINIREFAPAVNGFPIIGFQSPQTRALTVGYLNGKNGTQTFIPCRLNLGGFRQQMTFEATVQSLGLTKIREIIKKYQPEEISTITLLRETLSCNLPLALHEAGIETHYGDCYIGANHIKTKTTITTNYAYENTEGLNPKGLWIIADSIAAGRNLIATIKSLLEKYTPQEIIFIVPIGNRWGINELSKVLKTFKTKATFVVWGALFGLNPENHYDEPWGLSDCEPIDKRDQKTFIDMYSYNLCVGGDFGNDYYCPPLALKLYDEQIKLLNITPKIPTAAEILKTYKAEELVIKA